MESFRYFAQNPFHHIDSNDKHFMNVQKYVVNLYSRNSKLTCVNEARQDIFCHKSQNMESLPPTENALLQHTKCNIFQSGIWSLSLENNPVIPDPQSFGWNLDCNAMFAPVWLTISELSKCCQNLLKCACKSTKLNCQNCTCGKANIDCSLLCQCHCFDEENPK